MNEKTRYVVLGFENRSGTLGFALTSNPLGYLVKNASGEFSSAAVESGADLLWAVPQPSHHHAATLRDELNALPENGARHLVRDQSVPRSTIKALRALAADAMPGYKERAALDPTAISQAWGLLPEVLIPSVRPSSPPADLDDPFVALPRPPWGSRSRVSRVTRLPAGLCIFDLDNTLVDTSPLEEKRAAARRAGNWGPVLDSLDEVGVFPSWGEVAPHELPGALREQGQEIAIVSRAPRAYVERLLEQLQIEADRVTWACGEDKQRAFGEVIERSRTVPERTWVFGDEISDFRAATAVGAIHLGNPWICRTNLASAPDVAWFDAETLLATVDWKTLRYLGEIEDGTLAAWHRGSLLPLGESLALGRYFPARHGRHHERLSTAILASKESSGCHPVIAEALGVAVGKLAERRQIDAVVSVPPREGQVDRFTSYRRLLCQALGATDEVAVRTVNPVPKGYKFMSRQGKRELRAGRYACEDDLAGISILVIDDVVTTGSTLGAMADALREAGAAKVETFAWGATQD